MFDILTEQVRGNKYELSTHIIFVEALRGGKIKSFYRWDGRDNGEVIENLKGLGIF